MVGMKSATAARAPSLIQNPRAFVAGAWVSKSQTAHEVIQTHWTQGKACRRESTPEVKAGYGLVSLRFVAGHMRRRVGAAQALPGCG